MCKGKGGYKHLGVDIDTCLGDYLNTLLSQVNLSMPFQNHLQFGWQWEFMIPLLICTLISFNTPNISTFLAHNILEPS